MINKTNFWRKSILLFPSELTPHRVSSYRFFIRDIYWMSDGNVFRFFDGMEWKIRIILIFLVIFQFSTCQMLVNIKIWNIYSIYISILCRNRFMSRAYSFCRVIELNIRAACAKRSWQPLKDLKRFLVTIYQLIISNHK